MQRFELSGKVRLLWAIRSIYWLEAMVEKVLEVDYSRGWSELHPSLMDLISSWNCD